jgi:hypothetical protein
VRAALATLVIACAGLMLASCGSHPVKLTKLRCRGATGSCQDAEDPFKLLLAVDFADSSGTLGNGELELRVDGKTQVAVALQDIFNQQSLALTATTGTLNIDDDVLLSSVKDGQSFTVSLLATDGARQESNEPSLTFVVHLGGGQ